MRRIKKAFSHLDLESKSSQLPNTVWKMRTKNNDIRESEPLRVHTYQELVESVAQIAFYNQDFILFFRGQEKDFKDKNGKSTIYPSIYRSDDSEIGTPTQRLDALKEKFEKLKEHSDILKQLAEQDKGRFAGTSKLIKYEELRWAILQHYNIVDTPVIDLTHSLHVASSFALEKVEEGNFGIIQVLGMPAISGATSYFSIDEIAMIRLLAFAPPKASRLFMQEAYSASPFPFSDLIRTVNKGTFDFSRRLIAKFEIPNTEGFWGKGIYKIDKEFLFPEDDAFEKFLGVLMIDFDKFWELTERK
ncbi:MAG: FRG domain-containing protein [Balneola sp.]|jgi:hypothetical protein